MMAVIATGVSLIWTRTEVVASLVVRRKKEYPRYRNGIGLRRFSVTYDTHGAWCLSTSQRSEDGMTWRTTWKKQTRWIVPK